MDEVNYAFVALVGILGAVVGSFLNAAEWRFGTGQTVARGKNGWERSRCRSCSATLQPAELIPVFSFLFLRGRCRTCKQRISWQYPLVEAAAAALFAFTALQFGASLETIVYAMFISILLFLFLVDLKYHVLPDAVTLPAVVTAVAWVILQRHDVTDSIIGAGIAGGFFALQYVFSRGRWIGAGDIRLGILMGILLGWEKTLLALFIAYVCGALVASVLLALGRAKRTTRLPFGTFLTVATAAAIFFGDSMVGWYRELIGL